MDNYKPKEPLLAVMFGVMITGLGQIYSGKIKRGILFFSIPIILSILFMQYIFNPNTTNPLPLILIIIVLVIIVMAYSIFVIVDAYRCAKAYNISHSLSRNITTGKRVLLIAGIIFFAVILNPSGIVYRGATLYIRNNVVQAFNIPSKTMEPTLLQGDMILADKAIYKKSEPRRGDLIVFIGPEDIKKIFVKRLVGLPGETVEIKNGSLLVNGVIAGESAFTNKYYYNRGDYAKEGQPVKIPVDNYFVLGDNSALSKDSRYFGFVPRKYIIGKAYKIYHPFNRSGPIK